ncbi:hypothetical protein ACKVMT_17085 [Halobacteriales archaeon Cl-PHB]
MHQTRRTFLGVAGTVAVAGCLGGDDTADDGGTTPTATATATATATETPDGGATDGTSGATTTVAVRSHADLGDVLVDSEGMTLYMFDSDTQGEGASTCSDSCANAWPPLTVDGEPTAGDGVTADLSTLERADGAMQVAANGWPLYHFASDESPGDAKGQGVDGFSGLWWVLAPDGTPMRAESTPTPTATDGGGGGSDDGGVY